MNLTTTPVSAVLAAVLWLGGAIHGMAQDPGEERRALERHLRASHIPHVALAVFHHGAVRFVYGSLEPSVRVGLLSSLGLPWIGLTPS